MCNTSGLHYYTTCHVSCSVNRQLSYYFRQRLNRINFKCYAFTETIFWWRRGGKHDAKLQKMPQTKVWKFKPWLSLELQLLHWWQAPARKADMLILTPHVASFQHEPRREIKCTPHTLLRATVNSSLKFWWLRGEVEALSVTVCNSFAMY